MIDRTKAGRLFRFVNLCTRSCGLLVALMPLQGLAQQNTSNYAPERPRAERDGQHDFDFNVGVWKTHITRILNPLSGSTESIELSGTVTVRRVWGGAAQLEEIEADCPYGHCQGLTLFLYS